MNQHQYKCLIVDDEPIARKIVETYTAQYPLLQGKFSFNRIGA